MANAFSELNDPASKGEGLRKSRKFARNRGSPSTPSTRIFWGRFPGCLPRRASLWVDRLAMLFCDAQSIQEVLAFPWI